MPLPPRSLDHMTCVTPMLSEAVPPSVIGLVVAEKIGEFLSVL